MPTDYKQIIKEELDFQRTRLYRRLKKSDNGRLVVDSWANAPRFLPTVPGIEWEKQGTKIIIKEKRVKTFKQIFDEGKKPALKFRDESMGSGGGQSDLRLVATKDGAYAGHIDYTEFRDEYSVKFITVNPEMPRQGIGTALVLKLQKIIGKKEIDFGGLTDDGAKLIKTLKSKLYVDTKRIKLIAALQKEYKALDKEEKKLVKKAEAGTLKKGEGDRFDEISDRQYEIEVELQDLGIYL